MLFLLLFSIVFSQNFSPKGLNAVWDNSATAGIQNGAGTWDQNSANFTFDNGEKNSPFCQGCNISFGATGSTGTPGTVTVSGLQRFNKFTFGWVPSGNFTLSGTCTLECSNSSNCILETLISGTISCILSGDKPLIKKGIQTLTLSGSNTFSKGITISNGTLKTTVANAAGTSTITVNDADTGSDDTAFNWAGGMTFSNNILVNNQGTGSVTIGSYSAGASTINGILTVNKNITLNDSTGDRTSFTNGISGNGSLITLAGTRVTIQGANTFTGNYLIPVGRTLQINSSNGINSLSDVDVSGAFRLTNGGTFSIDGLTGTGAVNINTGGNSTLSLGNNNGGGIFSGVIANGTHVLSIVKNGTGTEIFSGANTYTGTTTVNDGIISCENPTGLGSGALILNGSSGVFKKNGCAISGTITCNGTCFPFDTKNLGTITGAYSLRRLIRAYTGPALRVRRTASGGGEQDINFLANGDLDIASLTTYLGSGDGFIRTWYDQSGYSRNAIQTDPNLQPRIMNAGILETSSRSGTPSLNFLGTRYLDTQTGLQDMTKEGADGSVILMARIGIVNNQDSFGAFGSGSDRWSCHFPWGTNVTYFDPPMSGARISVNTSSQNNIWTQFSFIRESTASSIRWNGVQKATIGVVSTVKASTNNNFYLGWASNAPDAKFGGHISEFLIFNSGLAGTTLTDLEANQLTYWNPALDQLSITPTGAYSLRKLRGAYTGPAIRVRKSPGNNEQDIGFTPNGDLDVSALTTFIGSDSGFVKIWYDQSGANRNATQNTAANQPRIVNAGVLETGPKTGIPSLNFVVGNAFFDTGVSVQTMTNAGKEGSVFQIIRPTIVAQSNFGVEAGGAGRWMAHILWSTGEVYFDPGSGNADRAVIQASSLDGVWSRVNMIREPTTSAIRWAGTEQVIRTNVPSTLGTSSTLNFTIAWANGQSTAKFNGGINEFIIFNSGITGTDLTNLETSQANYWGVP